MWQIIGQEEAVSFFKTCIKKGSLAHAYLFTGPPHSGKMTLAMELAKALNCESPDAPCGECSPCAKIADGKHADVRVINLTTDVEPGEKPRTEISIKVFRDDILKQVVLPPYEGKYRVYIFEDAENLNEESANCFLKTLEEPLQNVIFILLASNEKRIPATVISRCQHIRVKRVPLPEIESTLNEKYGTAPDKAQLIARLSHGAVGWAVTAAEDEMELEDYAETVGKIISLIDDGYDGRFSYAAALALQFGRRNGLVEEFLETMTDFWHDVLLTKLGINESITNINLTLELEKTAKEFSLSQVRDFIGKIRAATRQLELNASPRLVLEVLMLNMPRPKELSPVRK